MSVGVQLHPRRDRITSCLALATRCGLLSNAGPGKKGEFQIMRRRETLGLAAAVAVPITGRAQAGYPDRPIRWIVPFPAGGATDIWARLCAEPMAAELGQPVVIENRGGAGGMIGAEAVARAAPDGYTLCFTITSLVQSPVVMRQWPYDPIRDFQPIGKLGGTPLVFAVRPELPAHTLAEFVAYARGRALAFGSYSTGSTGHAFAQLLSDTEKLDMLHVPYRGEAPMLADLLGGRVACGFVSMTGSGEHVKSGKLRPLASIGTARVPSLPALPTFVELGYPTTFAWGGFVGLLGPARLPAAVLDRLAAAWQATVTRPDLRRRLLEIDVLPEFLGPAAFAADIAQVLRQWQALADQMNLAL